MSTFLEYLQQSYDSVGAFDADYVYIYSDFRIFVKYAEELGGRDNFCRSIVQPFIKRGRTVVVTTFTYTTSGCFDVLKTPTKLGALNKWILKQPGVQRSEHPLFSYAALGPRADFLLNIGKSAFGYDSVFDRLKGKNAVFLHVGRPVSMGNTILHHIEQYCGATYRTQKAFNTKVYRGKEYVGANYSAFLRRLDVQEENFNFSFTKAAQALQEEGLISIVGEDLPFSAVACYKYDDTLKFLSDSFYKNQCLFIESDFIQY